MTETDRLDGWAAVTTAAGAFDVPPAPDEADWRPVALPVRGGDDEDHWFRTRFAAHGADPTLLLDGLATVCDVYVDGAHVLHGDSMFVAHELAVTEGEHELAIAARALAPLLAVQRSPRARWRTRVVADGNLRWFRTSFFGRAPGFAPAPPFVGPWRPVRLARRRPVRIALRPRIDGRDGVLEIESSESAGSLEVEIDGKRSSLPAGGGRVVVSGVRPWWPHTHGTPTLYPVTVRHGAGEQTRSCGFRKLEHAADIERDGPALQVNGVPVFARGAVWTPVPESELRATLTLLRDGGLNLVRVVGTMTYESETFHDLCDELGLLVWQDLMFANLDYPIADETFRALVETEVRQAFERIAGRPSLAVVCGSSEVEQQVAMLGLDPSVGRGELFGELIPALAGEAGLDAAYLASAPTGGTLPFRTDRGAANYFGVGAYLRPLEDVRRAEVRFASECLAFANVPDDDPPDLAAGVMRDVGADWDFADVRDHYLRLLYGVERGDKGYWEHARRLTGELMAEAMGEWRREASPCRGAIVLWARDLVPGSGWGLLNSAGRPKAAWWQLRRALAPVAVWTTDEGLNGLAIHVANDRPDELAATLRLALYKGPHQVAETTTDLTVAAHSAVVLDAEEMLGRFVDITYAYRFGEPQAGAIVATLVEDGALVGQATRIPAGLAPERLTQSELGLEGDAAATADGSIVLRLRVSRFLESVRIATRALVPDDNLFALEPGRPRTISLAPRTTNGRPVREVELRAAGIAGAVRIPVAGRFC